MKVLVTGAKGMLGQDLCPTLQDNGFDTIETDIDVLDITDYDSVSKFFDIEKPEIVIPICIVAKNLLGSLSIFFICFAFLFPSFACFSIFASFNEINAISVDAKKAFIKINMAKTIRCVAIIFFTLPFFL